MSDGLYAKAGGSSDIEYPTPPVGLHSAVCVAIDDLGIRRVDYGNESKDVHKVRFIWEIEPTYSYTNKDNEEVTRNHTVFNTVTLSMHEKSNLRSMIHDWLGRTLSDEEAESLNLMGLIGEQCQILVGHREWNGKNMATVRALSPETGDGINVSGLFRAGKADESPPTQTTQAEANPFAA